MTTRHTRGPSRSYNRIPTKPDGRGPTVVERKTPVGADPLAVGTGVADTSAQMEHLAARRARLAKAGT